MRMVERRGGEDDEDEDDEDDEVGVIKGKVR